jgi:hypothetical protein
VLLQHLQPVCLQFSKQKLLGRTRLPGLPASLVELILLLFSASLLIIVKQLVLIR